MHGSVAADAAKRRQSMAEGLTRQSSTGLQLDLGVNSSENNLAGSLLSSAAKLRLLTCFFATAHIQLPVIDFASFSSRYNLAAGDVRKMSVMLNGGNPLENIPSIPMSLPPGLPSVWPQTGESTISTPGTTETLIAAMLSWSARFSDMPLIFGSHQASLGLDGNSQSSQQLRTQSGQNLTTAEADDSENSMDEQQTNDYSHLPPAKRPKRKQGVACDTCRLRRVRCDLMERKDGMPCTRCQDKKIVCTDTYIQQKRRDNEAKLRKEREKLRKQLGSASSGSGDGPSHGLYSSSNMAQLGDNPDPHAWTDMSGLPAVVSTDQQPGRYGLARQQFCQEMLTRAVVLVHKHKLMQKPSVEAVQVMVLLTALFELVDPSFSTQMSAAITSHVRTLGLASVEEVEESDTRAVENIFNVLQEKRVWCSTWIVDGISCCVQRRAPAFHEEVPLKIRGRLNNAGGGAAPELTPAMGLSYSVMAMLQVGVLARFVTKHIDNITVQDHAPPQERFPMLPSGTDMLKLTRACHAAWKSNDALIEFFDRCTLKSWHQMEALKIHQPKVWTASVKICSAMVTLSIFRILGERQRLNAAYLQAVSETHGSHVIAADDIVQSQALRNLFEESRQKTLIVCRRVARMVEKMHRRPDLTFQTGGVLLKQLFAVAQFLARSPISGSGSGSGEGAQSPLLQLPLGSQPSSSIAADAKQRHNLTTTGTFIPNVRPEPPASPSELYGLAMAYDAPLPVFTAEAKESEVGACLTALELLGFAWPVEEEVQSVNNLMHSERMKSAGLMGM